MSLISCDLYGSHASVISIIVRFSVVRDPLDMTSNKDRPSVRSWADGFRTRRIASSNLIVQDTSLLSLNATTSATMAVLKKHLDLYDRKCIGITIFSSSISFKMYPSCEKRPTIFPKLASAYPSTLTSFMFSFGMRIPVLLVLAYLTIRLSSRMPSFCLS